MKYTKVSLIALCMLALFSASARADDYILTLKDHQFSPANLTVPSNQKLTLIVKNLGPDKAEFESGDLDIEQTVKPGGQIAVSIGPLDPGAYGYFDDRHQASTGVITAR